MSISTRLNRLVSALVARRSRLPRPVNAALDRIVAGGGGPLGRVAQDVLGRLSGGERAPDRVHRCRARRCVSSWARRTTRDRATCGPVRSSARSPAWGREHGGRGRARVPVPRRRRGTGRDLPPVPALAGGAAAVRRAVHARPRRGGAPAPGPAARGDAFVEARSLQESGLRVAMMCHGTDVRLPSRHRDTHPGRPSTTTLPLPPRFEDVARKNIDGSPLSARRSSSRRPTSWTTSPTPRGARSSWTRPGGLRRRACSSGRDRSWCTSRAARP